MREEIGRELRRKEEKDKFNLEYIEFGYFIEGLSIEGINFIGVKFGRDFVELFKIFDMCR